MSTDEQDMIKATLSLVNTLTLASKLSAPAEADEDGIVGVTDDLKKAMPVAPILTDVQLKALTAAVNKAAVEGRHNVIAGIFSGIRDVVAKFTGLGGLLG